MKYLYHKFYLLIFLFAFHVITITGQEAGDLWIKKSGLEKNTSQKIEKESLPINYKVYNLNFELLKKSLTSIPKRTAKLKNSNVILSFPNGAGEFEKYQIFEASIMEESLQKKYPNIKSYIGIGVKNPSSSIRFSITDLGFSAMGFQNSKETIFIDPYTKNNNSYMVYKKSDLPKSSEIFQCKFDDLNSNLAKTTSTIASKDANENDGKLRTFRLAIATTGEYSQFHINQQGIDSTATVEVKKAAVLSAIVTTMTRVNAIFERDVALTMELVGDNSKIIFLDAASDGFSNNDSEKLLNESQTIINYNVGAENYDIGHTFSTGGGGLAQLNSPCTSAKAKGITGSPEPIGPAYDIDYVAHEMGHQFGAYHTFNSESGGCNGNINNGTAVEPGSGSTIMAYSGLCAPNNVQNLSDDYFHLVSVRQILANISNGNSTCAIISITNNNTPTIEKLNSYSIPISTPFALTANANDVDNDNLTYTWEQLDTETTNYPLVSTSTGGPAFRSLPPSENSTRFFPKIETVLVGKTSTQWEVLPSVARTMRFGVNVRDNHQGGGQTASDETIVNFIAGQGAFSVTSQSATETLDAGTSTLISWNVANTNLSPINCAKVTILLSTDGGLTFPFVLAENVDNDGGHEIVLPNIATSTARIKVKSEGNIFYAINAANISIQASEFIMNFSSYNEEVCTPNNAIFNFTYNTFSNFNETTTFSATNFPEGANLTFNPTSASVDGTTVEMVISNIDTTTLGLYNITVDGTSNSTKKSTIANLNVYSSQLSEPLLLFPENGSSNHISPFSLNWEKDVNKLTYDVEISLDVNFSSILESATVNIESYTPTLLENNTLYYWRLKGKNSCGESEFSQTFSFTTATIVCDNFVSEDIPKSIPDNNSTGVTSTIAITNNKIITDVNVTFTIPHQWVGDLTLTLTSPSGTSIVLSSHNGDEGLGYTNTTFNDDAQNSIGIGIAPFTGEYTPQGSLSNFNFEESYGNWTLKAVDDGPEDIGTIESWSIEICGAAVISDDDDKDGVLNNEDICPNTPLNSTVDATGCPVFSLPSTNFSVKVVGETCPDKNNGQIEISAQQTHNYIATVNGIEVSFTNSVVIPNLTPNTYEVCITVEGEDDFKQCFTTEILQGTTVSAKSTINSNSLSIDIEEGTPPFNIYVNDKLTLETFSPNITIDVKHGDVIQLKTSIECEGVYSKTVDLINEIIAYPNPTKGNFEIALPTFQNKVKIEVYNMQSQLISAKEYEINSGKVELNINNSATGLYFIKINLDTPILLKIIKD